jgi:hypothetical protein
MPRAKGQRTDLNSPLGKQAASSNSGDRQYGDRERDMEAQAQVPMRPPPGPPPTPDDLGPFAGPTRRPNEPITAGITRGPGPGPERLATYRPPEPVQTPLQRLNKKLNDPFLADLIARGGTSG